jgi:hypothetical protein
MYKRKTEKNIDIYREREEDLKRGPQPSNVFKSIISKTKAE